MATFREWRTFKYITLLFLNLYHKLVKEKNYFFSTFSSLRMKTLNTNIYMEQSLQCEQIQATDKWTMGRYSS